MGGIITRQNNYAPPQLNDYVVGFVIGSGGFGKVREIRRKKDDQWFALKTFNITKMTFPQAQHIGTELTILNKLPQHRFISKIYAVFRERTSISFVMNLFHGGDLRLLLRTGAIFSEEKVSYLIACIGAALHHLHLHGIIHRDVKPENIMFTSRSVPQLIDFGISYQSPPSSPNICICNERSGTKQYIAPEVFVLQSNYHSYESDFWSLGVVMYEILFHQRPYENQVPLPLVEYSEKTYQAAWQTLRQIAAAKDYPHNPDDRTICSSSSEEFFETSSLPDISLKKFIPPSNESTLPADLLFTIPEIAAHKAPISKECQNLLHSLLDVRIHTRLGVGENYPLFTNHSFFTNNNNGHSFSKTTSVEFPSPIQINLELIGTHIWNRHFSENLEESDDDIVDPPDEIDEYFNKILNTLVWK